MNARHALARLGLAGALGLALLIGSAWTQRVWLTQQQAKAGDMGSQARRLRHELLAQAQPVADGASGAAASEQASKVATPEQAWQTLWQALPTADRRVALQTAVLAAAQKQGVNVTAVQYRGQREAWASQGGVVLWRQRMVMPAEGSYPAVRAWLAQMLQEPALSIDDLDVQRSDVMSEQVKARVTVSLWWRKKEGAKR